MQTVKIGKRGGGYFSLERSQMLKGVLAIGIVLFHSGISGGTGIAWFFGRLFASLGTPIVACFFFITGYGLLSSYIFKKEKYLDNFLSKRLSKVIVPFVVAILLYQILLYLDGIQLEILTVLKELLKGDVGGLLLFSWFVFAIIYFYVSFYVVYRYLTNDIEYGLFYLLFFTILYMYVTKFFLGWGAHWYVSAFAFNTGLLWKYNEKAILTFLQKKWYALFTLILLPFVVKLIGEWGMASLPIYPILILIIFSLINIPNIKLFSYLGAISYEIYLLHGIPRKLLRGNHIQIQNDYVFILLILIITIVLAAILHRGITMLRR